MNNKEWVLKTFDGKWLAKETHYDTEDKLVKAIRRYVKHRSTFHPSTQANMSYAVEERDVAPWVDVTANY